jgi:hypothetical protein
MLSRFDGHESLHTHRCMPHSRNFHGGSGPSLPPGASLVVGGLEGPRGLTFGPDGLLYVAEAGHGGTQPTPANCEAVVPPVGPYHGGPTARVSRIESNGTRTTVIGNLPSALSALPSGDTQGVADVRFGSRGRF